ncbi:MAG TPA: ATP-binding protein [Saprospiraceae bacterium]|nr:ATP-binding protein [Saprospiraceae bacterium]
MVRNVILVKFLCFFGWINLAAQQQGIEWLTTQHGLSQGFISGLHQDKDGFLWIGTKNGLNRFDGYRFDVFTSDPYDEYSLFSDYINHISEYGDFMVVSTQATGINLFHKKTRLVYRIDNHLIKSNYPSEELNVFCSYVDALGHIWATINEPGGLNNLCKISLPDGFWEKPESFRQYKEQLKVVVFPEPLRDFPVISTNHQMLYVRTTTAQIVQVNLKTSQWTTLVQLPNNFPADNIAVIDPYGELWISNKIAQYHKALFRLKPGSGNPIVQLPTPVSFQKVMFVNDQYLWIDQFENLQLYSLDASRHFDFSRATIPSIPISPGSYCALIDHSGLHWIGTNGLGIMKINVRSSRFQHLFPGMSVSSTVFMDRQGSIFSVHNQPGYIYHPGRSNNANPPFWSNIQSFHPWLRINQDKNGTYWVVAIGKEPYQLTILKQEANGKSTVYRMPSATIRFNVEFATFWDEQGILWVGLDEQLIRFNPETAQFDLFEYNQLLKEAKFVTALTKTANGHLWIGRDIGLVQAIPANGGYTFKVHKNDPKNRNSLRNNNIASLLADPREPNILWIGTKGGGLNRLDTRTMQFTHLTTREGLPNDVIYGILPDERNRLWMSSNKGLICYDPGNGAIKNFTKEDGLQDNEFNTFAYGKGPDGALMFGGVNGLTVFYPQQLLEDTLPPRICITGLRLNNQDVSWKDSTGILSQGIEYTNEITIPFSRNNLTLEFVALSFTSPNKNRFKYYLEGAEEEWEHESSEHTASYLNLSPGTYVFRVKGSNSEGVWSREAATLKITVLPPWYRSWWAWMAYVLLLGGGVYAFYRYQLRTKLEHAEVQRLKELDTFKSRFFTNITHEFRTPLTVILGMTDRLEKNEKDTRVSALQLIRRNGQNLLRLINEILDLAKLESNTLRMDYVQGDVLPYLRYISESLHSLANVKNVMLRVESSEAEIVMDYDPERMLQIVHNLLSNAIKFTPGGGRVMLRAAVLPSGKGPEKQLRLEVTDTGVGISPEDLPQVFERFFQAQNQEHNKAGGTGVGLSLTRELVRAMGGDITVESTVGKGSTFTVLLPISRKAPQAGTSLPEAMVAESGQEKTQPAIAPKNANSEALQLLIIEDNADVVEYLADCIGDRFQLDFAYNGRAGIEKALETVPDIIISDVMMPEKDGFEVCDALKNDERTSHIPIVLLTARATVEDRIAGLRRGADAYLAKPFNPEELLATMVNLTRLRARLQARYGSVQAPAPAEDKSLQLEDAFLQKLRAVVEAHLSDSDFEMPHLQRKMAMSHSQIFRKTKALTGKSPSVFIRDIRLEKARELLSGTELTVSEIAYETGFSSLQYFSDAFFEAYGKRPSAMRN